jgi:hypothetical protein
MPAAALLPSNAPTAEYRRHHAVEEPVIDEHQFRPAWRRRDRLDKLVDAGAINIREYRAALVFRRLHERALTGASASSVWNRTFVDRHCRAPLLEMTEAQATALARLDAVKKALGALYELLEMCVVGDVPWCRIGQRFAVDPKTARKWAAASIAALAAV